MKALQAKAPVRITFFYLLFGAGQANVKELMQKLGMMGER